MEPARGLFGMFDQVRIINLVDRPDRRREMLRQLERVQGIAPNVQFFDATRPSTPGEFPSLGARGCFESHLAVLKAARDARASSLLLLEDDFDFTREGLANSQRLFSELSNAQWDFFYGAHVLPSGGRCGLVRLAADEPVLTASFVGFGGNVIPKLVEFLEGVRLRPAGSPEYGPMHVDGAYTVFRSLHPDCSTLAAFPTLGKQRSSPSDITPGNMLLDRWPATRSAAALLRRAYNWWKRH